MAPSFSSQNFLNRVVGFTSDEGEWLSGQLQVPVSAQYTQEGGQLHSLVMSRDEAGE